MYSLRNEASVLVVLLSVCGFAVGCGSSGGGAEAAKPEATSGGDMAGYEGPIQSTDTAGGKDKFETFCGDCHPDGGEDEGPSLIAKPHTPGQLRKQIREGSGKMRPFSEKRLSNPDVESMLAWLATVGAVK